MDDFITHFHQRIAQLEEQVAWLMHHQHIGGQYSEPVHIHLTPERAIHYKQDVTIVGRQQQGDQSYTAEEQEYL